MSPQGRRVPMTTSPTTLLGLTSSNPPGQTAIIVPEQNVRVTYGDLRTQVQALAEALKALGIERGDRVGMAIPNSLQTIICFLAASEAGTAAPLNPAYKEDEFRFYLEDTNAEVLLLPPDGAEEARRAAQGRVPVVAVEIDGGIVRLSGITEGKPYVPPSVSDVALVLHTSGSTGRPKRVPLTHANLSISAHNVAQFRASRSPQESPSSRSR